ncbi:MAG TPA: DUF1800 domain-containing protein [Terracidiphilus sp.]|jgi:uncharacterized protein (DUF1800 family)
MQRFKAALAVAMCLSLLAPTEVTIAQDAPQAAARFVPQINPPHSLPSPSDQRILHALNRFTFGPRPGDVDAVQSIGLERWFDEQLHPANLDESVLNARLAQFPAMQSSSEDLLYRLPSNAVIRRAIDGKIPVPAQATLHAVYENQMVRVAEKKQDKQAANSAAPAGNSMTSPPAMAATPSIAYSLLTNLHGSQHQAIDKDQAANAMNMTRAADTSPAIDPAQVSKVLALQPQQRVSRLLSMQPAEANQFFKSLRGPQRATLVAGLSPAMKEDVNALENPQHTVVEELMAQRLTRDIYSNAQLQEVMTDFWLNHFNVFLHKNEATPYYVVSYERDVIRPHSLGKFEDLLQATAHSPAMMLYLDNAESIGPESPLAEKAKLNAARNPLKNKKAPQGLNENYARELMELHTLGVNGGYTQADVTQVARILTGWTVDRPQRGGVFKFDPSRHEPGVKKVLGKKFKDNNEREGRDLLHMLATRPATAHFISRKLAIRFVSDDPPQSLVDRMAKSYMKSNGDIASVLRTMFHAPEFWTPGVYRAKVKTPLEFVVSAARACNADLANLQTLANALRDMGMPLYGAVPPTGYKWDAADWVSTGALVTRMNFALSLAANRLPGITTKWSAPASDAISPQNPEVEEARLEFLMIGGGISNSTRAAVLQQFAAQSQTPAPAPSTGDAQSMQVYASPRQQNRVAPANALEKQDQILAGLLLGSPEFQRR